MGTRKVNGSDDAWMLQQPDGRIVFVIPYERDFSLIGTTETTIAAPEDVRATDAEVDYLLAAVNRYLSHPISADDIVHRFAGVRPLVLEDGKDARETTRDYRFVDHGAMGVLTVVGGKITTYRRLAEAALKRLAPKSKAWTKGVALPGGDVPRSKGETGQGAFTRWLGDLIFQNRHYDPALLGRLARIHGTALEVMLERGLGENLGGIFTGELERFRDEEWATTADDVLWRRTKYGLHLDAEAKSRVSEWFNG
jgi:glycerol-3-phosphate dehydrogenase